MHLTLCAYNSWAGTGAYEHVCHVIRVDTIKMLMCFSDWSSIACETEVQHLWHFWMHAPYTLNITQWRCHYCAFGVKAATEQELGLSQLRVCEVPCDDQWHTYDQSQSHIYFEITVFCKCNFVSGYNMIHRGWALFAQNSVDRHTFYAWGCSAMTTVTSGQRIILMLSGNKVMEATWPATCGLELSVTLLWVSVCYLTAQLLSTIVIFWKLFYHGCMKVCLWLWGRGFGFVIVELQHSMGRISYPGRWIGHGGFIVWPPWLLDLTLPDIFLWGLLKVHVKQFLQGLSNILWQDPRQLWHWSVQICWSFVAGIQCRVYFAKAGNLNGSHYFACSRQYLYVMPGQFIWTLHVDF